MTHRDYLSQGQGVGVKAWVQKAVATVRANTIVLADDPELQIPVSLVGNPILVRGQLIVASLTSVPDLRYSLNYTGAFAAPSSFGSQALQAGSNTPGPQTVQSFARNAWNAGFAVAASVGASPIAFPTVVPFEGILYAQTPGLISLRWCQNTSNASSTALAIGCWMSAERMDNVGVL